MIKCEYCGHTETEVLDSRTTSGDYVKRRRRCKHCGKKITTYEIKASEIVLNNKIVPVLTEIGLIRGKLDRMERLLTNAGGMAE